MLVEHSVFMRLFIWHEVVPVNAGHNELCELSIVIFFQRCKLNEQKPIYLHYI